MPVAKTKKPNISPLTCRHAPHSLRLAGLVSKLWNFGDIAFLQVGMGLNGSRFYPSRSRLLAPTRLGCFRGDPRSGEAWQFLGPGYAAFQSAEATESHSMGVLGWVDFGWFLLRRIILFNLTRRFEHDLVGEGVWIARAFFRAVKHDDSSMLPRPLWRQGKLSGFIGSQNTENRLYRN
jgi:hypothetical protein